ncbi:hypothetical protein DPMN_110924 [Dreissena polymorpha]|uniref:Uncharacterized protein n=1 Tax=Dreissena polymorpha TaxID=45954 RepID=A0A9D4KCW9_DREPO|nr:hypothetical protein DPMN_110924 [Dreissena polymorpha]
MQNWRNVQSLLRDQEATLSEMARLEKYLEIEKTSGNVIVDKAVVARVDAILVGYTEDMVRKVNNTLAAYFRWVRRDDLIVDYTCVA